jgi:hypothetical protein
MFWNIYKDKTPTHTIRVIFDKKSKSLLKQK